MQSALGATLSIDHQRARACECLSGGGGPRINNIHIVIIKTPLEINRSEGLSLGNSFLIAQSFRDSSAAVAPFHLSFSMGSPSRPVHLSVLIDSQILSSSSCRLVCGL